MAGMISGGLAQLARAPALHAGGHRFESDILHSSRRSDKPKMSFNREFVWMRPKSIHGGYNCDVSIKPLQSETYTDGVTIRRDEYLPT